MPMIPVINKDPADLLRYFESKIQDPNKQRRLVLVIVCIVLLLDNMLYMVIVPIIPIYLQGQGNKNPCKKANADGQYLFNNKTCEFVRYDDLLNNKTLRANFPLTAFHGQNAEEDARVGILFASKAIVQLFFSPFAGTVIDKFGYDRPMLFGLSILFVSTAIFAFGESYNILFMARSLQGVGSAFADTSGLAMIADRYKEDSARTKAQGIALAFISFGCLFAPPFGGILYEYCGKAMPFLVLAFIALIDGLMLRFVMTPVHQERAIIKSTSGLPKGTPIYLLILDPYIALCAGALVMANVSLAFLEPTIALWMEKTFFANEVQIGMVWLPAFFPHVLGVYVAVQLAKRFPTKQWLVTAVGLALEGFSCLLVPFCTSYAAVIFPLMIDCFGIALVDTAILPTLAYLVDVRHVSVYGSVYAIADFSYSLAYAFGPIVAGWINGRFGFTTMNVGIFVSNIVYAPLLIFLKNIYKYKPFEEDMEDDNMVSHRKNSQNHMSYHMDDLSQTGDKQRLSSSGSQGNGMVANDVNYGTTDNSVVEKTSRYNGESNRRLQNGSGKSTAPEVYGSTFYRADSLATNLPGGQRVEPVVTPRTAIYIARD